MKVEPINPSGLERSSALSQGTKAGDWIFVSGQWSRNTSGLTVGVGDFEAQADRAFECVAQVLAEAGGDLSDIVKLTAYLGQPPPCSELPRYVCPCVPHPSPRRHYRRCRIPILPRRPDRNRSLCPTRAEYQVADAVDRPIFYGRESRKHHLYLRTNGGKSEGQEPPTDFPSQLHAVYQKLDASLADFGAGFSDLVKINYFITNPLYYRELYRIREEVFEVDWPGDSVVSVRALDAPHALVETDAVALAPPSKAEFVNSPELPPPFNFSNVVVADGLAYVSGQVARDKDKNLVLPGDFDAQFRQALKNVEIALNSVGCSFENAVKVSCFISHAGYFEQSLNIRREVFKGRPPAVTSVAVDSMGGFPEALCEIDAIAAIP